jgi:hypothetical protein
MFNFYFSSCAVTGCAAAVIENFHRSGEIWSTLLPSEIFFQLFFFLDHWSATEVWTNVG